ncbi:hypothetical protein J6590_067643 [Homalodisca vitripennis]|nr:hypothetical protein J6590_067643 [Homalodisca vitripennis]
MAGEIGKALLEENKCLKAENLQLNNTIRILEDQISGLKAKNNKFDMRQEELQCLLNESDQHNIRMRDEKASLQDFFETRDSEQLKLIMQLESEIDNLKQKLRVSDSRRKESTCDFMNESAHPKRVDDCKDDVASEDTFIGDKHSLLSSRIEYLQRSTEKMHTPTPNSNSTKDTSHVQIVNRKPPSSAKLRLEGECLEDIFERNLEEYLNTNRKSLSHHDAASMTSQPPTKTSQEVEDSKHPKNAVATPENNQSFLDVNSKIKSKWKRAKQGRQFVNSSRKSLRA